MVDESEYEALLGPFVGETEKDAEKAANKKIRAIGKRLCEEYTAHYTKVFGSKPRVKKALTEKQMEDYTILYDEDVW